jgi:DNA-binding XRE family transcriptional regulator
VNERKFFMAKWVVEYADEFFQEVQEYSAKVQQKIAAMALLLEEFGPELGRPKVDILKGSKYSNMKELRFDVDRGVWRVAFAFDPKRKGILLNAGDKSGVGETRFYRELIAIADERYDRHLARLRRGGEEFEMSVPLKKVLQRMSPEMRAGAEADAARMIAEELTLRDLRKALHMTQERLAAELGVKQESISSLEKRSDMLLSTLRHYVGALGGELELLVKFPDRPPVVLKSLSDIPADVGN